MKGPATLGCVVGLVLAVAAAGCHSKPPRSPRILGSHRPAGDLQAPPVNSRTPIAVPSAPVATPAPAVPVVPAVPAQPVFAAPPQPVGVVPTPPAVGVAPTPQASPPIPTPTVPQNSAQEYRPPAAPPPALEAPRQSENPNANRPGNDPFFGDDRELKPLDVGEPGKSGVR